MGATIFFNTVSVLLLIVFNFTQFKRKKGFLSNFSVSMIKRYPKHKLFSSVTFWTLAEIFVFSLFQSLPVPSLNSLCGNIFNTGMNYFGLLFFLPIIMMACFYVFSINPLKQLDLITPAFPLTLITIKFACFCDGCCHGIECSFGLYNQFSETVDFPVQLIEMAFGLIIFIFLMIWRNKAKEGALFPVFMIMYCSTRFFSEFLRHERNIFLIFKTYHLLCLAGILLGIIELILIKKYHDKIIEIYNGSLDVMKSLIFRYIVYAKDPQKRAKFNPLFKSKNIVHHKKRKKKKRKK